MFYLEKVFDGYSFQRHFMSLLLKRYLMGANLNRLLLLKGISCAVAPRISTDWPKGQERVRSREESCSSLCRVGVLFMIHIVKLCLG